MPSSPEPDAFAGFRPAALEFFDGLARNLRREWFEAHRQDYEREVRAPMLALVAALGPELRRRRIPLLADPRRAPFRIHRDVRFSRDKRPYKTHAGAALTRNGEKLDPGMLYVHVDPLGCFAAAGFWRPPPAALRALREAIAGEPAVFRRCVATLARRGLPPDADGDALARLPRGFEAVEDADLREWLRWKSIIVTRRLDEAEVASPALPHLLGEFCSQVLPLLRFGWAAIDAQAALSPPSAP